MDIEKYEHILRPLRELEQVWGIDLAGALQEYAAEVAAVTYEMGCQMLNFAQAAMLIMGASTLYSKKVDALQELVQDTYFLIINKGQRTEDDKNGKGRRRRVVVREPVKFTDSATKVPLLSEDKRYRDDVPEFLRQMLAGLDPTGSRGGNGGQRIAEGELIPFEDTQTGSVSYRLSVCAITDEGLLLPNVRHELSDTSRLENVDQADEDRGGVKMPPTPAHPTGLSSRGLRLMDQLSGRKSVGDLDKQGFDKLLEQELDEADDDDDDEKPKKQQEEAEEEDDGEEDDYDVIMKQCMQDRFKNTLPDKPWEPYIIRPRKAAGDPSKAILADLLADKMISSQAARLRHLNDQGELVWDNERMARLAPALYRDLVEVIKNAKSQVRDALSKNRKYERWLERQRGDYGGAEAYGDIVSHRSMSSAHGDMMDDLMDDGFMDGDDGEPTAEDLIMQSLRLAGESDMEVSFYSSLVRYDELLYQHNLANTDRQANLTKEEALLHSRITAWTAHLEPALEEQLGRGHYDIYVYAQRILDTFDHVGQILPMRALTDQCRGMWEVSRFFLAMLQLSNNGNLYVDANRIFDGSKSDIIHIRLITKDARFAFESKDESQAFAVGKEKLKQLEKMPDLPAAAPPGPQGHDVHRLEKKTRKRKAKAAPAAVEDPDGQEAPPEPEPNDGDTKMEDKQEQSSQKPRASRSRSRAAADAEVAKSPVVPAP